jgi:hypothetical protein
MPATVQELAEKVTAARQRAWEKSDPTTVAVTSGTLGADDERVIRLMVAEAGYSGHEAEEMVNRVTARLVGRMEAMADDMPAAASS